MAALRDLQFGETVFLAFQGAAMGNRVLLNKHAMEVTASGEGVQVISIDAKRKGAEPLPGKANLTVLRIDYQIPTNSRAH